MTPSPTSATSPGQSLPLISGKSGSVQGKIFTGGPLLAHRSSRLSEVARTRINASQGPGTGRGDASYLIVSGPPCSRITAAIIVDSVMAAALRIERRLPAVNLAGLTECPAEPIHPALHTGQSSVCRV